MNDTPRHVAAHEPALDRQVLDDLRAAVGDETGQFITSVAEVYETQAVELTRELTEAARDGDTRRLAFAAHSLRGSSANVGGNRLASLCAKLEQPGLAHPHLMREITALRAEVDALLVELRQFVSR